MHSTLGAWLIVGEALPRALSIVLRAFGPEARSRMLGALTSGLREATLVCLEGDPVEGREQTIVEQILAQDLMRHFGEDPERNEELVEARPLQVSDLAAIVFLHGSPQSAAEMLPHLPETLQTEIIRTLCTQSWDVFERHVGHDEAGFVASLDRAFGTEARRTAPDFAVSILSSFVLSQHLRRLLSLYRIDSGAANDLRSRLFSTDDLDRLSDRELQTVLTGIDDWDVATAMNGFPRRLKGRVLVNVSDRRAKLLEEDVVYLSDTEDEEIAAVQRLILERARGLYESGRIQTYLGSIAAVDDPVEEETRKESAGPRKTSSKELAEETKARTRIPMVAVFAGLVLLFSGFLGWFGASKGGRSRSRGGVSVEDYARSSGGSGGGPSVSQGSVPSPSSQAADSRVMATKGAVLVYTETDTLPLGNQPVLPGHEIVTGGDGEAVLSVGDEARAHVGTESIVRLGEGTADDPRLRIRLGRVWVRVIDPRIEVASPVALVLGSQGAIYELRVVLSSATTVRVKDGTAWVTARLGDDEEQIVVAAGRYVHIDPRSGIDTGPATDDNEPSWLGLF